MDTNSDFKITSQAIGRMTVFPTLTAVPVKRTAGIPSSVQSFAVRSTNDTDVLWHNRFSHASATRVTQLIPNHHGFNCESCILGKQPRTPFKSIEDKATDKLGCVHIDHCGIITPSTYGGGKYALNLRDQATGYTWVYVVPDKSAETIIKALKQWKPMVENQAGTTLKVIRTDDAKEFKSVYTQYLQQFGVVHEATARYSSSSNGTVERVHRTLFDMVRPMLIHAKLPTPFWGEAIITAAKVLNRLPTKANANNMTPHEAWFGKKPSIKHLRVFGCIAYATLPIEIIGKGNKPAPRAIKCCFLGYYGNRMYRLLDLESGKAFKARDVKFNESEFFEPGAFKNVSQDFTPLKFEFSDFDEPEPLNDPPSLTSDDGFLTPNAWSSLHSPHRQHLVCKQAIPIWLCLRSMAYFFSWKQKMHVTLNDIRVTAESDGGLSLQPSPPRRACTRC